MPTDTRNRTKKRIRAKMRLWQLMQKQAHQQKGESLLMTDARELFEISRRDLAKSVAKYLKKQRKKYPDAPHVHPSHFKNLARQSKYYSG
jgi:hypothetical protein